MTSYATIEERNAQNVRDLRMELFEIHDDDVFADPKKLQIDFHRLDIAIESHNVKVKDVLPHAMQTSDS